MISLKLEGSGDSPASQESSSGRGTIGCAGSMRFGISRVDDLLTRLSKIWRLSVRAGDLVRTTRASIGVPLGSIGLIIETHEPRADGASYKIHELRLMAIKSAVKYRRFLSKDLEVVR